METGRISHCLNFSNGESRTKLLFLFVNLHPEQVLLLLKNEAITQESFSKLGNIL